MDISALAPDLAKLFGLQPSTLVLLIFLANIAARAVTRAIPNDATGGWAILRNITAVIGTEVASRVTSGVTVADVAKAALQTPPIPQKVEEEGQS